MNWKKFRLRGIISVVIGIVFFVLLVAAPALSGTIDDLKAEGADIARTVFYPILVLMNPQAPGVSLGTESFVQYVSAFILIFALIYNVFGKNKLVATIATLVIMTWINYLVPVMDWHVFFVRVMPALFVYLVTLDIMRLTMFRTVTIQFVGLFGFAVTYWFRPTTQLFDAIFGAFSAKSMGYLIFLTFTLVLTRMFKVIADAVWYGSGKEASIAINRKTHEAKGMRTSDYGGDLEGRGGWGGGGGSS